MRSAPLPIAAEIDARLAVHRQPHDAIYLRPVQLPAMILARGAFLREPQQIPAGDMVMMANLAAPHATEKAFGRIGVDLVRAAERVGFLMVDPVERVAGVQLVP